MLSVTYLVIVALLAFGLPIVVSSQDNFENGLKEQGQTQAQALSLTAGELLSEGSESGRKQLRKIVVSTAVKDRARVLVADAEGRLVFDSAKAEVKNVKASRKHPPLGLAASASTGAIQQSFRDGVLVTTVTAFNGKKPAAGVQLIQRPASSKGELTHVIIGLGLIGLLVLALSLLSGRWIARRIAAPIARLQGAANQVAEGELTVVAEVEGSLEQRDLATAFNTMVERLRLMIESQKHFIADASHQLRTPLSVLRLDIEMAQMATVDEDQSKRLAQTLNEVDRLEQTLADLLVLSRLESSELDSKQVDVGELLQRLHERWQPVAVEHGLKLVISSDRDNSWSLTGDRLAVEQAVEVLIENAINYSTSPGVVTVGTTLGEITVSDQGPGFEEAELPRICDRFYRGSSTKQSIAGTGLGLAIAKTVAEDLQGSLQIKNNPDVGATVTLSFKHVEVLAK